MTSEELNKPTWEALLTSMALLSECLTKIDRSRLQNQQIDCSITTCIYYVICHTTPVNRIATDDTFISLFGGKAIVR